MRGGDAQAGERASLLFARADEDVEARAPLARGERASSRPSRAQCAAAAVVAILGASAVTGASRSHLPRLGSRQGQICRFPHSHSLAQSLCPTYRRS